MPINTTMDGVLVDRMRVARNPWQGEVKHVLCIYSAGILRSPTAAEVISP